MLPSGTLAVGGGLLVQGVTAYGFLVVSARALGPERYAGISVLWALTFLVAFGFFMPLEQELARGLASLHAQAGGSRIVRRVASVGAVVLGALVLATVLGSPLLLGALFDDQLLLVVSLGLSLSSYLLVHLARGILAGSHALGSYGVLLATDGLIRLAACVALAVLGTDTAGPYGLVFALSPLVALALAVRPSAVPRDDAEAGSTPAPHAAIGHLVAGSLLSQVLMNGPVPAVKLLATDADQAAAGRLLAGLAAARLQLFLFSAVLVALLPKLAALAAQGEVARFKSELRKLAVLVGAIGAVCTMAAAAAGEPAIRLVFGSGFSLGRRDLVLLTAANAVLLLALTCFQSLVALAAHQRVAVGWGCGVVGFLAVMLVPAHAVIRVEVAFLAGSMAATVALAALLADRLRSPIGPGVEEPTAPALDLPP